MSVLNTRIVLRNDSSANWNSAVVNAGDEGLVLLKGEIGLEFTDNGVKMKVGDGTTKWQDLSYFGGDSEDARVFEATVNEGETHNDALVRATSGYMPNTHDIGIVAELIAIDAEGNEKYQHTAYRYNGTAWAAMDGNYNANNVYFDEDMLVTTDIGYITTTNGSATIPSKGKNLAEVFEAMFVKEQDPEKTDPSVSVTLTGTGSYEVGTIVSGVSYSASFEDGNYSYGPEPTGATVTNWSIVTSDGSYTTASGDLPDVTVSDDTNFSVTAKATHTAGETPLTNKGNPCTDSSKKITSGVKSKTSGAITGYRSFFYGILDTTSEEAPLTSAIIRNQLTNGGEYNKSKSLTLKGNDVEGAKRIVIAIPSNSTRNGLSEVILTSAMNTPITKSYVKTSAGVKVEGLNGVTAVDYDTYVYEPSKIDAGEVHAIKLA